MQAILQFYSNLFLRSRLFLGLSLSCLFFVLAFFFPLLNAAAYSFFGILLTLLILDVFLLFSTNGIDAARKSPDRLSNGDLNTIGIRLKSQYSFRSANQIIDELPSQFQIRNFSLRSNLQPGEHKLLSYTLRPTKRGEYGFGRLNVYVSSPIGLIQRRYTFGEEATIPVFPSVIQMRRYQFMAMSDKLVQRGVKKIRRLGQSMEFEHIKSYVPGDDPRRLNWKATARRGDLMVNSYTDEKSQNLYCIIDKSRVMKMPFEGLSLLDYAINTSLALCNIALLKEDRVGLITISEKIGTVLLADRKPLQLRKVLETLYKEKSRYLESNIDALYSTVRTMIKQRSLLLFFTNFESLTALNRQIPYLRKISNFHLVIVIFFENTELTSLSSKHAATVEDIYIQTIASKLAHEKQQIVKELNRHGIQAILTRPENLTVNTINKYLEIKKRGYI